MGKREQTIPLCRTEFLQDFSIELGRKLKPIRHASKSILAEVGDCEHKGQSFERLTVWIETWNHTRATLALWEDQIIWVNVALLPTKNNKRYEIAFYPRCKDFTTAALVEALRDTVSVSTKLCYNESPLPTLRRIWHHEGEVETIGKFNAGQKTSTHV